MGASSCGDESIVTGGPHTEHGNMITLNMVRWSHHEHPQHGHSGTWYVKCNEVPDERSPNGHSAQVTGCSLN